MGIAKAGQLGLFAVELDDVGADERFIASSRDIGTFKDSLRAPIHRWFKYPAGYSYKLIEEAFDFFGVKSGDWVLDPFSGSGTTLIEAKKAGVNGVGIEAHFFVHWVAATKLYWEFDLDELRAAIHRDLGEIRKRLEEGSTDQTIIAFWRWLTAFSIVSKVSTRTSPSEE